MKTAFHIHTHYSYDCLTSPKSIVKKAHLEGINLLIITDHDTLQGSIIAKRYAASLQLPLEIPIAGEFLTDIGDVIIINVPEDFKAPFSHGELCRKAKDLGGYTVLPHPYDAHDLSKVDFDLIDGIEVFNSRSSKENDEKAKALAEKHQKPIYFGADSHFLADMTNAIYENKTPPYRKALSQAIKGFKQRDLKLFLRSCLRATRQL